MCIVMGYSVPSNYVSITTIYLLNIFVIANWNCTYDTMSPLHSTQTGTH